MMATGLFRLLQQFFFSTPSHEVELVTGLDPNTRENGTRHPKHLPFILALFSLAPSECSQNEQEEDDMRRRNRPRARLNAQNDPDGELLPLGAERGSSRGQKKMGPSFLSRSDLTTSVSRLWTQKRAPAASYPLPDGLKSEWSSMPGWGCEMNKGRKEEHRTHWGKCVLFPFLLLPGMRAQGGQYGILDLLFVPERRERDDWLQKLKECLLVPESPVAISLIRDMK